MRQADDVGNLLFIENSALSSERNGLVCPTPSVSFFSLMKYAAWIFDMLRSHLMSTENKEVDRILQRPWPAFSRQRVVCCFLCLLILSKPISEWILHHIPSVVHDNERKAARRKRIRSCISSSIYMYKYERQSLSISPLINIEPTNK